MPEPYRGPLSATRSTQWIGAEDVMDQPDGEITVTIAKDGAPPLVKYLPGEIDFENGRKNDKEMFAVRFDKTPRQLLLNSRKRAGIVLATGTRDHENGWPGKRITLYVEEVRGHGGKRMPGVSVKKAQDKQGGRA